jgi:hypothetical protein
MRSALFWGVCIPVRVLLACCVRFRVIAAIIGARWLLGFENAHIGFFGGPAWWADERPVHGLLYMSYALSGNSGFLLADVLYGASLGAAHA